MKDTQKYTPMMQQYLRIKEDYADAIVFFRLGDFYEMFFDDAIVASKVLEIALTSRDAGEKVPMCGIPYHASKVYIQKLIQKGFKIAIAEQVTEPGKGLVERQVVKFITPGMILEDGILDASSYNFIGAIYQTEYGYILSYADISTGDTFLLDGLNKDNLISEVKNLNIREIILKNLSDKQLMNFFKHENIVVSEFKNDEIIYQPLLKNLNEKVQKEAASLLLNYLFEESKQELRHLLPFTETKIKNFMHLDHHVLEHLELVESMSGNPKSTLLYWLDQTKTAMGSRLLRYFLTHPLTDIKEIESRLNYIEAFQIYEPRQALEDALREVYDINRLVGRIASLNANARDLVQLKNTLKQVPKIKEALNSYQHPLLDELNHTMDNHDTLFELLDNALKEDVPISVKEGGMIKEGFNQELDELRMLSEHGESWLNDYLETQKELTGIKNLKIGYNRVFGYFIEVSKGNIPLIKEEYGYIRKQTLANNERYITEELKTYEDKILNAKAKAEKLEYDIFVELRNETNQNLSSLLALSQNIAKIDTFLSLAKVADMYRYVRPRFNQHHYVEIESARHPVVERHVEFVSNHITMKPNEIFILTGPNMSGKSTYMRMFAIMVVMAQTGMFVPASKADLPIYDAIFTRIGSSDDIAGGKSTFMVEMVEANEALQHATSKSLILFDEIGRGTATYDGMALAQGMIEYIHNDIKAQTLFSTHYHELTKLSEELEHVTNLHVKAKENKDQMVFLYQIERGPSDKSYGIQVAALANLPEKIIKRSKQILKILEKESQYNQVDLFTLMEEPEIEYLIPNDVKQLIEEISNIDTDQMTPIDALIKLKYLQNLLKKK